MGTAVVGLVLAAIAAWVIYSMIKDKKSGNACGGCSSGCG